MTRSSRRSVQPWRRERHDLIGGRLIYQPIFAEQSFGGEQAAQLLQVFHCWGYFDLRQGSLAVAPLDQGCHFCGPYALATHGALCSLFMTIYAILAHGANL